MKRNYVNKQGKIVINDENPPTEAEYRTLSLRAYVQNEIRLYSEIRSILCNDPKCDIAPINERIATLVQAKYELVQKQPPALIECALRVRYSTAIKTHI